MTKPYGSKGSPSQSCCRPRPRHSSGTLRSLRSPANPPTVPSSLVTVENTSLDSCQNLEVSFNVASPLGACRPLSPACRTTSRSPPPLGARARPLVGTRDIPTEEGAGRSCFRKPRPIVSSDARLASPMPPGVGRTRISPPAAYFGSVGARTSARFNPGGRDGTSRGRLPSSALTAAIREQGRCRSKPSATPVQGRRFRFRLRFVLANGHMLYCLPCRPCPWPSELAVPGLRWSPVNHRTWTVDVLTRRA